MHFKAIKLLVSETMPIYKHTNKSLIGFLSNNLSFCKFQHWTSIWIITIKPTLYNCKSIISQKHSCMITFYTRLRPALTLNRPYCLRNAWVIKLLTHYQSSRKRNCNCEIKMQENWNILSVWPDVLCCFTRSILCDLDELLQILVLQNHMEETVVYTHIWYIQMQKKINMKNYIQIVPKPYIGFF